MDGDPITETRVQHQRRLQVQVPVGVDGPGAWDGVVRTRAATATAARGSAGTVGADGSSGRSAVRRRVSGIAASRRHTVASAAAVAAAAAPAPGAVSTTLDAWDAPHVGRSKSESTQRVVVVVIVVVVVMPGPHRSRYAVLVHVDDALFDGRQPRRRGL